MQETSNPACVHARKKGEVYKVSWLSRHGFHGGINKTFAGVALKMQLRAIAGRMRRLTSRFTYLYLQQRQQCKCK